jgi:hypothetical protein
MKPPKYERLRKLREEFEQIHVQAYEDWTKVESWFRKAQPTIQNEWSEHLNKFQKLIHRSRFWTYEYGDNFRAITTNELKDRDDKLRQAPQRDAEEAKRAKQEVLEYLDGLLRLEEIEFAEIVTYRNSVKEDPNVQDDSFENPTDLWKARRSLPPWLWATLVIVILVLVPLLAALIQGGLPIIFRQESTNTNINANVITSPSNVNFNSSPIQKEWILVLQQDKKLEEAEKHKRVFERNFDDPKPEFIILYHKSSDGSYHYRTVALFGTSEEAKGSKQFVTEHYEKLEFAKKDKDSPHVEELSEWCKNKKESASKKFYICSE